MYLTPGAATFPKTCWTVVFFKEGADIGLQIFVNSVNGEIIDSEPSGEELHKYYSRRYWLVSMDSAIILADKKLNERNIDLRKTILKIEKETLGSVYDNYSSIRPKLSEAFHREQYKPIWKLVYRDMGANDNNRDIVVLIDAIKGEVLDVMK